MGVMVAIVMHGCGGKERLVARTPGGARRDGRAQVGRVIVKANVLMKARRCGGRPFGAREASSISVAHDAVNGLNAVAVVLVACEAVAISPLFARRGAIRAGEIGACKVSANIDVCFAARVRFVSRGIVVKQVTPALDTTKHVAIGIGSALFVVIAGIFEGIGVILVFLPFF